MIERLLHLRPGDFRKGLPLFSYYFLIIGSSQIGQVARDSLVLDRYSALSLPYLDLAVSALIGFVVAFYIRLGRALNLRSLLVGSLCLYTAAIGTLWWAIHFHQQEWVYTALYLCVGIIGALAPAQVWTLANFVWTTREAKRLFALLGSGGILGGVFAGFLSAHVSSLFGAESLLLLMAIPLIASVGIVIHTWNERPPDAANASVVSDSGPQNLRDSLRLIADSPHLRAIASLVLLSSIVATIAAWQTKAIAQATFVSKDAMAFFFGQFDGYVCVIALAAQLFLTGKVLRRFGIGVALAALPVSLFVGSAAVVVWGSLWAVCLTKGSDRVFRYSMDTSAQQLLYMPVSGRVKLQVKSFIDTVIWRLGGGIGGLVLLIFATNLGFTAAETGWLCLIFVSVWVVMAVAARRQYVAALGENIRQLSLDDDDVAIPMLDSDTSKALISRLRSADAAEALHALRLCESGHPPEVLSSVRDLLDHSDPALRSGAIAVLREVQDGSVLPKITKLMHNDEDLTVRTEALSYLSVHDHIDPIATITELGRFSDFSISSATIAFLARPGEGQNIEAARVLMNLMIGEHGQSDPASRRAAAELIGLLPDYFEDQLAQLLDDPEPEVVRQALRSLGNLRNKDLASRAIRRLEDPSLSEAAEDALVAFEDSIVEALRDSLNNSQLRVNLRRRIPDVLLRIGTPAASNVLAEGMLQADSVLRYRIISALNKLQELHQHPPLDRGFIETVMLAEIIGHYRSYQIRGLLGSDMEKLLSSAIAREVERIFRLMKLLFPTIDLENAYRGIQSTDHAIHANALEFLENTLSPSLRTLLIPLIDSEVSASERIRLGNTFLNTAVVRRDEAVAALIHSEDPWFKASAVYAIEKFRLKTFDADLERLTRDPDPVLQEKIAEARALLL